MPCVDLLQRTIEPTERCSLHIATSRLVPYITRARFVWIRGHARKTVHMHEPSVKNSNSFTNCNDPEFLMFYPSLPQVKLISFGNCQVLQNCRILHCGFQVSAICLRSALTFQSFYPHIYPCWLFFDLLYIFSTYSQWWLFHCITRKSPRVCIVAL